MAGHGLGQINPALYSSPPGPTTAPYFYDVTTGNNQADPSIPGYPATTGWDPVTGLGTPNAATLVPALAGGRHRRSGGDSREIPRRSARPVSCKRFPAGG